MLLASGVRLCHDAWMDEPHPNPDVLKKVRGAATSAVYFDVDGGWSTDECAETADAVLDALQVLGPQAVVAAIWPGVRLCHDACMDEPQNAKPEWIDVVSRSEDGKITDVWVNGARVEPNTLTQWRDFWGSPPAD